MQGVKWGQPRSDALGFGLILGLWEARSGEPLRFPVVVDRPALLFGEGLLRVGRPDVRFLRSPPRSH